jgi:hypothetical protein
MAILMRAEVPGMGQDLYDQMTGQVGEALRQAPGFVSHVGFPSAAGWTVIEVWETQQDWDRFLQGTLLPAAQQVGMPEPKIETTEVYGFVVR